MAELLLLLLRILLLQSAVSTKKAIYLPHAFALSACHLSENHLHPYVTLNSKPSPQLLLTLPPHQPCHAMPCPKGPLFFLLQVHNVFTLEPTGAGAKKLVAPGATCIHSKQLTTKQTSLHAKHTYLSTTTTPTYLPAHV